MTMTRIEPWGTFEIDDATGLPVVAEDMFFRVTESSEGFWKVELHQRTETRKRWGKIVDSSVVVEDGTARESARPITSENVRYLAGYCIYMLRNHSTVGQRSDASLVGDYPPKSLG